VANIDQVPVSGGSSAAVGSAAASAGPARPTAAALVAHRPLSPGGVRLGGGLLGDWQQRNRAASLPQALKQMEAAGNLDNLRLAISGNGGAYRGPAFMDSDLYKTLEAISWELGNEPSAALAGFAADATALLRQAQQDDGYLNSFVQAAGRQRYQRLASSHELYCAGHLIQAAVAASRTFDNGALLQVARRFADHLVASFLGGEGGLDGHPIVETALVELYRETGTAQYLELASQFVETRGRGLIGDSGFGSRYLQDHVPVRESTAVAGHAVRALYLEAGVTDVAIETADRDLLAGSAARWADMVATKTALTGGAGSRHSGEAFGDSYELPPDRAYNETCAAIASFQWAWRLLLATGEARYAELMERILYNGFGASMSADGQRFFYVNPLQRRDDHFENDDPGRRQEWFSCACCPPNIMRVVASLGHYAATVAADVLYLHLLTESKISVQLAGGALGLDVMTRYPWSGAAELRVTSAPAAECGLALRIPAWTGDPVIGVNGEPAAAAADGRGYLVLRRQWRPGDVLTAGLSIRPRVTVPGRRVDAVRGCVAVERGPLVYCFEQADQEATRSIEDLAVSGGLTERAATLPGVGETVRVLAGAAWHQPAERSGLPYAAQSDQSSVTAATAVAIPYFQWDNRDGGAMRVWMPSQAPGASAAAGRSAGGQEPGGSAADPASGSSGDQAAGGQSGDQPAGGLAATDND
jgi:hypothetical protein